AIFGILYLGQVLSLLTVPLLLAMLLAYLFEPVVRRMTALSWVSRQGAAIAIIVVVALVVIVPVTLGVGYAATEGYGLARRVGTNVLVLRDVVEAPNEQARERQVTRLPEGSWQTLAEHLVEARRLVEQRRLEQEAAAAGLPPDVEDDASETAPQQMQTQTPNGPTDGLPGEGNAGDVGDDAAAEEANGDEGITEFTRAFSEPLLLAMERIWTWVETEGTTSKIGQKAFASGLSVAEMFVRGATSLIGMGFGAFLTGFFFFFICTSWGKVLEFWRSLIPERRKGRVVELVKQMDAVVAGFIRGRLTIMFIQIVFFSIGYTIVGVPAGLILGVVVGILALVPYLAMIGMPIAIVLMLLDPPTGFRGSIWWIILAPTVVYQAGQLLDDYVLTPRIQGKATGMDTPTVLFASIAGGILAGFYGLLVAIPVAACVKIMLREIVWPRFNAWARGEAYDPLPLGGEPSDTPTNTT
ncbi:MAG: AI-2E family transporter, partial [Planctomycetota bacterium]